MRKRPVSSRPWPPEGYVDPRRVDHGPRTYRGAIGLAVAFVALMIGLLRILVRAHSAVSGAADPVALAASTPVPVASVATTVYWNFFPMLGLGLTVALLLYRLFFARR